MKRVILCVSALLAGGFAFAQTPKTVTPQSKQALAPNAAVGGNLSTIDQVGIGSDGLAVQEGTMNTSYINQTGTSASNRNLAIVAQSGNVGDPGIARSGFKNYADLTQDGEGNQMGALQLGDKNTAWGNQLGNDNVALMEQGAVNARQAQNNYAEVAQTGNGNEAEVQQRFDNNIASSTQDNTGFATGNRSYQEQVSAGNQSNGHTAISTQRGGDNEVRQFQTGPNSAVGNYAEANQGDINGTDTATGAYAQQIQSGSGQQAYINQKLAGDEAYQEQLGANNVAVADQNLGGVVSGGDNFSSQYQDGTGNDAEANQNGNNNESFQEQFGVGNSALTVQKFGQSAGNYAQSIQTGNDNDSQIRQNSNGNFAQVDQFGSNHMSIVNQNQLGTQLGNASFNGSNTASVLQRDANGLSNAVQTLLKSRSGLSPAAKTLSRL
ncbi:hypothetical protein [Nonlabens antarcticus]|uniref:hypothetical protein n=1 Tax=Nonlabens antarcticus TaxID=392714 RepID=UPI00189100E2|nr:hypothetical protein [Nonlabens antarcticus]